MIRSMLDLIVQKRMESQQRYIERRDRKKLPVVEIPQRVTVSELVKITDTSLGNYCFAAIYLVLLCFRKKSFF